MGNENGKRKPTVIVKVHHHLSWRLNRSFSISQHNGTLHAGRRHTRSARHQGSDSVSDSDSLPLSSLVCRRAESRVSSADVQKAPRHWHRPRESDLFSLAGVWASNRSRLSTEIIHAFVADVKYRYHPTCRHRHPSAAQHHIASTS